MRLRASAWKRDPTPGLVSLLIGGEQQQFVTGVRAFDWRFAYIENLTTHASYLISVLC